MIGIEDLWVSAMPPFPPARPVDTELAVRFAALPLVKLTIEMLFGITISSGSRTYGKRAEQLPSTEGAPRQRRHGLT